MGDSPRSGDAREALSRAAAFDSQCEASVRSADRHTLLPSDWQGATDRSDRSRSGRPATRAAHVSSASGRACRRFTPVTTEVTLPSSSTASPEPTTRTPPSPTESSRRRPSLTAAPTRVTSRSPFRGSSPRQSIGIARRTPFARRQRPTPDLLQSRAGHCSGRSRVSSDALFQSSNGTRDRSASGSQYQKPDRHRTEP